MEALLARSLDEVKQLVRVQHMDRPEVPLLAPSQSFFLRENLKLRLLGARLALLSRDQTSYKADLKAAREWIIVLRHARKIGRNALGTLRNLHEGDISIEMPEIAGTLDALRVCASRATARRADTVSCHEALIWVIALFVLAVGLVVAARYNDGFVLIVLPPYRVEIALNLLLVALAGGFVLLYSVSRLVTGAVDDAFPGAAVPPRSASRKAQSSLLAALEAYFEGRYAQRRAGRRASIELGEHARLSAIIAARAAHELRAYDRRDRYLRELRKAPRTTTRSRRHRSRPFPARRARTAGAPPPLENATLPARTDRA